MTFLSWACYKCELDYLFFSVCLSETYRNWDCDHQPAIVKIQLYCFIVWKQTSNISHGSWPNPNSAIEIMPQRKCNTHPWTTTHIVPPSHHPQVTVEQMEYLWNRKRNLPYTTELWCCVEIGYPLSVCPCRWDYLVAFSQHQEWSFKVHLEFLPPFCVGL